MATVNVNDFLKKKEERSREIINSKKKKVEYDIAPDTWSDMLNGVRNNVANTYLGITQGSLPVNENRLADMMIDAPTALAQAQEEPTWFTKGAFEDGRQKNDLWKTILGTMGDIGQDLTAGLIGAGESLADAGAYLAALGVQSQVKRNNGEFDNEQSQKFFGEASDEFTQEMSDFIKADTIDQVAISKKLINVDEKNSVLGAKADSVVQSGGQMLGTAAASFAGVPWWLTTGATAFGSQAEAALNEGATFEQAGTSALISAGAEVLTEKLGGISFGGATLDDAIVKQLARGISNKFVRNALAVGVKGSGEGVEEWISNAISEWGESLTYADPTTIKELLFDEEALDAAIGGFLMGGTSASFNAVKSGVKGVDYASGMTANEQKVVDKVYKDLVAEAEKTGKQSGRQKSKIYDDVLNRMEKGYISIDTIEEVLGGNTYKTYKDTLDKEDALQKEYEELGGKDNPTLAEQTRYKELHEHVRDAKNASKLDALKKQLGTEVMSLVKGDRLAESYNERSRRGQAFEADVSKYDAKQQVTIQKAIDSGILNNTNRTHEFVDLIAKITADKGVSFDFTNNEKLKESGFAVEGASVNGYVTKDGVTLNVNSAKSLNSVVGHEITHVLKGTDLYKALETAVVEYAKTKGEYDTRLSNLTKLYEKVGDADINAELVADLVGDYLFTDSDFIRNLSAGNRNVFQKIFDEIKYLCRVATAGSEEAKQLEKVKKAFEDAYRATKDTVAESGDAKLHDGEKAVSTKAETNEAYGTVENILAMDRINNTLANEIIHNAEVSQAFTDITGVALEGTTEQKRQLIRDTVREWQKRQAENEALAMEAGEQTTKDYENFLTVQNALEKQFQAEDAVRDSGYRSYIIGMLTPNGTSTGDAMEILRNPELKAEWEAVTGKTLPQNYKSALKMIRQTKRDPQRLHEQEVQFSLSNDTAYMDKAIAANNASMTVDSSIMEETKVLRERIAGRMNEIKGRGLVALPDDVEGNTYIANSSYDGTEENTTICPRSLASEAFVDAVSEYLGRPLTVEEQIYISQDLQGRTLTPECLYCYVATDRKAYRAFLGEYVKQRDAVLEKIKADPNADLSRSGALYKEFLKGRKDTSQMYNRFKMWADAYKNGKPMIDASHLANINKLMGDINSEFGAELKPQIVDAMKYAQSASWAKKRVNYVAYNGHILNWKQDRIRKLNSHYGLRMYSFSDFHPAFVLENMQMITDASVRGLKMLGYTKDTDFVEIFAPTGMNINVSTFGFESGGQVFENNIIGAEWEKAKALREQYPNVGVTFVATNDTIVEWALAQDWIDVVIPYHLVRTGAEVAKALNYTNYTSESSDTKTADWKKGDAKYIAPTEHNNDKATYLAALKKNHLKPRFERFLNNPNYMKLVNECRQSASESKPVQPIFNEDAAMKALAKLEANGYYQPIGGSVDRMYEIAGEVAEAMAKEIAPTMSPKYSLSANNGSINSEYAINGDYAPVFYSQMGKVIDGVKQEKLGAASVVNMLRGKGVKAEEIKWSGIEQFLEGKKSVTKQELQEFVRGNQLLIKETMLGGGSGSEEKLYASDEDGEVYGLDGLLEQARNLAANQGYDPDDVEYDMLPENVIFYVRANGDNNVIMEGTEVEQPDGTHWSEYKLDGGSNYRELLFQMPDSEYSNTAMQMHWDEGFEGVLAHARMQDFDTENGKMLFIEEIQSDWHNEGHKSGYKTIPKVVPFENTSVKLEDGRYYLYIGGVRTEESVSKSFLERRFPNGGITEEEIHEGLLNGYNRHDEYSSAVPDAPFRNNYHEYVLKRLLRMAAEEGYDSIGWTTARQQVDRWSKDFAEGYRIEYDQDIPKFLNKYGKQWGAKVTQTQIGGEGNQSELSKALENYDPYDEYDIRWMAQLYLEDSDPDFRERDVDTEVDTSDPNNLVVTVMDIDTGEEWSMTSSTFIRAKNSGGTNTVWTLQITDAMKQSVLYEGQPQYSLSEKDKDIAPIGNYNVYGSDVELSQDDIAPIGGGTVSKMETATVQAAPEDEFIPWSDDPERFDSLDDADAPPVWDDIAPVRGAGVAKNATVGHGNSGTAKGAKQDAQAPTVKAQIAQKIANFQTELENNARVRAQSRADFDTEIARLREAYNALPNKNTMKANDLLRRIERRQRMKKNVDADYANRIENLEKRIEKMSTPEYQVAAQRQSKQQEYTKQMEDLIGDTSTWVDKKWGLGYQMNTLKRNLRDVVRKADGSRDIRKADAIYDELQGKYNHNEAKLKTESNQIKKPYADLKITKAEDTYIQMLGELRHNPDTTLSDTVVNEFYEKHKGSIDTAKVDKVIDDARKTYDELLIRVNEVLREQGMKEIPYRKGYFPHFTEDKQSFLAKLFNWKTRNDDIPTDIAGLTEQFNPNRSWQSFNKQRTSDTTDYSFMKGMDTYVQGALDWIHHIEDIQKRRAFENYIRYVHSEQGVKDRIDALKKSEEYDADQLQEQIDLVYAEAKNPLNNFVVDLRTGTNTLANKKSSMDRIVETDTNRRIYSVMTNISNRVSANMVAGSVSSALTNFIPITQSWGVVSPVSSLKAMGDTIRSTVRDDGTIAKSDFLTNRLRQTENLYKSGWDRVSDKVGFMMEAIDSFTSQTVWRSKYIENMSNGMSENEAIKNADQFAEGVMAGRSRGNQPTIFDAKNPIAKVFTAFQLEVANQYGYFFKDMPQDMQNEAKTKLVMGYAKAFIGAYAYNALYSKLTGRDAAFDPIGIIEDLLRDLGVGGDDEEEEIAPVDVAKNLFNNVMEEVPFIGGIMGGGRIPLSSALPYDGNSEEIIEGFGKLMEGDFSEVTTEWLNPVYYLAMPMAGGQIRKTMQGLSMFSDDHPVSGSYTESGKLRYAVEDTVGNRIKAAVFGQYASQNARQYFDEGRTALADKQIREFKALDMPIQDYWAYQDAAKAIAKRAGAEGAADDDILKDKYLNSVNSELSELIRKQEEVLADPKLSDEKKQKKVEDLQKRFDELSRERFSSYNTVTYDNKYREGGRYATVGDRIFKLDEKTGEWEKLDDDAVTKYKVTKAAGNAMYADDGKNYYRWYKPEGKAAYWDKLDKDQVTKYLTIRDVDKNAHYATNGKIHYRLEEGGDPKNISDWTKISDKELARQQEVTSALGITPDEYWSRTEKTVFPMYEGEYEYAFDNPENYAVAKAVGGYDAYRGYSNDLSDIKSDKDANGKSISGSRKAKVLNYINSMDADYYTKLILWKSEYPSDDSHNVEIIEYLNGRNDLSYDDKVNILKELDFKVSADGRISW